MNRVNHPETVVRMLLEAWGFIATRFPVEEVWPTMMRESMDELRAMFPGEIKF